MDYQDVVPAEAYKLLNSGGVVFVCTRSSEGQYDLAPVAWTCPLDYDPVSRAVIVLDPGHATCVNIMRAGYFALALPTYGQKDMVLKAGSIHGHGIDKFVQLGIPSLAAVSMDVRIPEGSAGWVECRTLEVHPIGSVVLIAGEIVRAKAVEDAWKLRIHHGGGDLFYKPGELV